MPRDAFGNVIPGNLTNPSPAAAGLLAKGVPNVAGGPAAPLPAAPGNLVGADPGLAQKLARAINPSPAAAGLLARGPVRPTAMGAPVIRSPIGGVRRPMGLGIGLNRALR